MKKGKEINKILDNEEKKLFENKTLLVDLANLILDFGGLKNFYHLLKKVKKYNPKQIYFIADASLKYKLSPEETEIYLDLVAEGIIRPVPYGTPADLWLIQIAVRIPESCIVTNDALRDFLPEFVNYCDLVRFYIIADDIYFNIDLKDQNNGKNKLSEASNTMPDQTKTDQFFSNQLKSNQSENIQDFSKKSEPYWLEALYGSKNKINNEKIEIY